MRPLLLFPVLPLALLPAQEPSPDDQKPGKGTWEETYSQVGIVALGPVPPRRYKIPGAKEQREIEEAIKEIEKTSGSSESAGRQKEKSRQPPSPAEGLAGNARPLDPDPDEIPPSSLHYRLPVPKGKPGDTRRPWKALRVTFNNSGSLQKIPAGVPLPLFLEQPPDGSKRTGPEYLRIPALRPKAKLLVFLHPQGKGRKPWKGRAKASVLDIRSTALAGKAILLKNYSSRTVMTRIGRGNQPVALRPGQHKSFPLPGGGNVRHPRHRLLLRRHSRKEKPAPHQNHHPQPRRHDLHLRLLRHQPRNQLRPLRRNLPHHPPQRLTPRPMKTRWLGQGVAYQDALALQEKTVAGILAGTEEEHILFLEHAPVYTIGRTRDQSSLHDPDNLPHPAVETNRGGQATYHGPGQLVAYPLLDLRRRGKDLHRHLRALEDALAAACAEHGVPARSREGLTGVWTGGDGNEKKIASLGVGVRKWVTMHGLAINVTPESLPPFQAITPCGLDGVSMTCLWNQSPSSRPSPRDFSRTLTPHLQTLLAP